MKNRLLICLYLLIFLFFVGCSDISYYSQGAGGHLSLMSKRIPIEDILDDSSAEDNLKYYLQLVMEARIFAKEILHLPVAENFSTYADVGRPYVVWNVVATPAYSLASYEWCYPITGCLPYRGYFKKSSAEEFADSLRQRGLDAHVYGVPAYSTLGWFDDPVLNTFIHYPETSLVGLIFHELAHQIAYAKNDGDFNEAFATSVEQEGIRRWLLLKRTDDERAAYYADQEREGDFLRLISDTRRSLLDCYDGRVPYNLDQRETCKNNVFDNMRASYRALKKSWRDGVHYDRWFKPGLNNARFVSSHTYRFFIPAFEELLRRHDGDLPAFYAEAKRLASLPAIERRKEMTALRKAAIVEISNTSAPVPESIKILSPKSGI